MSDVFQTDDAVFHQAALSLNKLTLIHLVVERLSITSDSFVEWDWVVWPVQQLWAGDTAPVTGREPSLSRAKRKAFDIGISLLADLMRDNTTTQSGPFTMRLPVEFERHGHMAASTL